MADEIKFFRDEKNQKVLSEFKKRLDNIDPNDQFETNRNSYIALIIGYMLSAPDNWDKCCQYNINLSHICEGFISRLSDKNSINEKNMMDSIFSDCYIFLLELDISTKDKLPPQYTKVIKFGIENIKHFEQVTQIDIQYAAQRMPIDILKSLFNDSDFRSFKDFISLYQKANTLTEKWNKDLNEREKRVNDLKNTLNRYKTAFNFVGLYEGFNNLYSEKEKERKSTLWQLWLLGIFVVVPVIINLFFIYQNLEDLTKVQNGLLAAAVPTISLVAILIYYFRVLLSNYKSVKSQLLQISLRKTLCQFIQSYADYAKKIKKEDSLSLEKFENIIFSSLVANDDSIPSTFDGFNQVKELIKLMKN